MQGSRTGYGAGLAARRRAVAGLEAAKPHRLRVDLGHASTEPAPARQADDHEREQTRRLLNVRDIFVQVLDFFEAGDAGCFHPGLAAGRFIWRICWYLLWLIAQVSLTSWRWCRSQAASVVSQRRVRQHAQADALLSPAVPNGSSPVLAGSNGETVARHATILAERDELQQQIVQTEEQLAEVCEMLQQQLAKQSAELCRLRELDNMVTCKICFSDVSRVTLLPCRHQALCSGCAERWFSQQRRRRQDVCCPICKQKVVQVVNSLLA